MASRMGYRDGPLLHVNASIAAGAITAIGVTPFWVIKTRLQTQHALVQIKRITSLYSYYTHYTHHVMSITGEYCAW
jgi:hypothetical protein